MAAESGLFDTIAHADLCKKFAIYPQEDCTPLFENFVRAAKRGNVAIEINTAGLRKPCREIYPNQNLLELAFKASVPITFGSDAHATNEVGMNFNEALQLARNVGYSQACRFTNRRREIVELPTEVAVL